MLTRSFFFQFNNDKKIINSAIQEEEDAGVSSGKLQEEEDAGVSSGKRMRMEGGGGVGSPPPMWPGIEAVIQSYRQFNAGIVRYKERQTETRRQKDKNRDKGAERYMKVVKIKKIIFLV